MRVQGQELVQIPLPEVRLLLQVKFQYVLAMDVPLQMSFHMVFMYPVPAGAEDVATRVHLTLAFLADILRGRIDPSLDLFAVEDSLLKDSRELCHDLYQCFHLPIHLGIVIGELPVCFILDKLGVSKILYLLLKDLEISQESLVCCLLPLAVGCGIIGHSLFLYLI